MDYSQFLYMHEELSLLAVIVILFMCPDKKSGKGVYNTALPVILLTIHTLLNLLPCCGTEPTSAFGGMYQYTPMMTIMKSVLNVGTIIVFLMAHKWLTREENLVKQGEFYMLTLFTLLGMYFMISSGHFLMFFIGLEMASVPVTALVAFDKKRFESAEAGAKFILLALFSSALLLYGVSLIYGATGTLYFSEIGAQLDGSLLSIFGMILFIAGLGFKISLVPFHLWTADTYEGAPTSVTAYLSVISKGSAAFVLLTVLDHRSLHHRGQPLCHSPEQPQAIHGILCHLTGRLLGTLHHGRHVTGHDRSRVLPPRIYGVQPRSLCCDDHGRGKQR